MMPRILASCQFELELLTTCSPLVGIDRVRHGALVDPAMVDACIITGSEGEVPSGLADSKLLNAKRREELAPQVRSWATASTVTWALSEEIDRFGIIVGLHLVGVRALARIEERIGAPALVFLDGSRDWLTSPEDFFASLEGPETPDVTLREMMTRMKADTRCILVAAASVIAKVARDEHMAKLEDPGYGWASDKGYSSPQHMAGLKTLGPSFAHRRSWSPPEVWT